jgi:3-oxoadipate enol-lactonase
VAADSPARFGRLVFVLPATLDRPRATPSTIEALVDAIDAGDAAEVADLVSAELPPAVRGTPAVWAYLRQRVDELMRDGLSAQLVGLPGRAALDDRAALAQVEAPALVIGCHGDDTHPVEVAQELAAALPNAALHVYDHPGLLWTARTDLRSRISAFLNDR